LEELFSRYQNKSMIPLVQQCVEFLREHGTQDDFLKLKSSGMQEEGLFRVSGSHSEVESLTKCLHLGTAFPNNSDPHAVASILKKFLRELPESLIPSNYHPNFVEALGKIDK
jgi:hypothetical protein